MSEIKFARVRIRTHHFIVDRITLPAIKQACTTLSWSLVQYKLVPKAGSLVREADRVYASSNPERSWYRFHINSLPDFKKQLDYAGVKYERIDEIIEPLYKPIEVEYQLLTDKSAYDYQQNIIDNYLLPEQPYSKLVDFQTGKGKGLTLQLAVKECKARLLMIMRSSYLEKWKREMHSVFKLRKDDIELVQGSEQLKSLIARAREGKVTAKIIMVGLTTVQMWINVFERSPQALIDAGYQCTPDELCEVLQVGIRAFDEVHQCFHQCFTVDLYTHAPKTISMSATLFNKDPFIAKMYELMFPAQKRFDSLPLTRYTDVVAMLYYYHRPDLIQTTARGSTFHSAGAMETSLLKHKPTLKAWCGLIQEALEDGFIKVNRAKKRVVIYVYLKEMVKELVKVLSQLYPQYRVESYIDKDPLDNILTADITVSTLGSAGTNLDIPDLTNVVLARDITSVQSNIQLLGRLRELKSDNHPVTLHYISAANIPKSYEYHLEKMRTFKDRVRTHKVIYAQTIV